MRSYLYLIFLGIFVSCKSSQPKVASDNIVEKKPLFIINDDPVYSNEFIYAYNKSAKNNSLKENVEDYLDLYVNFKLKVAAAKKEGLDTLPAYKEELAGYLNDIKKPYLTSEKVNEALLEETYNRLQQEVQAAHILVQVKPDASPADTLKAYNKIKEIKSKFENGVPFEKLAIQYSEDPSVAQNKGDLGWFTAFQMVYPFESAAYNTAKGALSDVVKTKFGYHLIYVRDKRETSGKIKIAHIMLRFPINGSVADSMKVKKSIYVIHNQLIEGETWFSLAVKYSEDLNSKDAGGSLPWFGVGGLPKSLEDAAFKLSQPGQISSPVKSPYGWHIIKLEEKRGLGSLENMRESLSRRIQRDQRSELKTDEVISKLKVENEFLKNEAVYNDLGSLPNLNDIPSELLNKKLFSIKNELYQVKDLTPEYRQDKSFKIAIENFERDMLLAYEDRHLGEKYPEYKLLASEYRDGLLLFEIMSDKVWNKIGSDTVEMRNYYLSNQSSYLSPIKVKADIFLLSDSTNINLLKVPTNDSLYQISQVIHYQKNIELTSVIPELKQIPNTVYASINLPKNSTEEVLQTIKNEIIAFNKHIKFLKPIYSEENKIYLQFFKTADKYLKDYYSNILQIETGVFEANKLLTEEESPKIGESVLRMEEDQLQLINIIDIIPQKQLSYEEAKSEVITDYQSFLEIKWIRQLKEENKVIVNQDIFKEVKEELEK